MINPVGSLNSAYFPKLNRSLQQPATLHPAPATALVSSATESAHSAKKINSGAAAIGYPALGNSDMNSVVLLDALARASQTGMGVSAFENGGLSKSSGFGAYSALGQLTPSQPAPGSLVSIAV